MFRYNKSNSGLSSLPILHAYSQILSTIAKNMTEIIIPEEEQFISTKDFIIFLFPFHFISHHLLQFSCQACIVAIWAADEPP